VSDADFRTEPFLAIYDRCIAIEKSLLAAERKLRGNGDLSSGRTFLKVAIKQVRELEDLIRPTLGDAL
jgi:hypothetical protein